MLSGGFPPYFTYKRLYRSTVLISKLLLLVVLVGLSTDLRIYFYLYSLSKSVIISLFFTTILSPPLSLPDLGYLSQCFSSVLQPGSGAYSQMGSGMTLASLLDLYSFLNFMSILFFLFSQFFLNQINSALDSLLLIVVSFILGSFLKIIYRSSIFILIPSFSGRQAFQIYLWASGFTITKGGAMFNAYSSCPLRYFVLAYLILSFSFSEFFWVMLITFLMKLVSRPLSVLYGLKFFIFSSCVIHPYTYSIQGISLVLGASNFAALHSQSNITLSLLKSIFTFLLLSSSILCLYLYSSSACSYLALLSISIYLSSSSSESASKAIIVLQACVWVLLRCCCCQFLLIQLQIKLKSLQVTDLLCLVINENFLYFFSLDFVELASENLLVLLLELGQGTDIMLSAFCGLVSIASGIILALSMVYVS